jgi:hypothetical protein
MLQSLSDMKTTGKLYNLDQGNKRPKWHCATVPAILLLMLQSGAAPLGFGPPGVQSPSIRLPEVNLASQLQSNRNSAQASGGQSQEIPKTFVDMSPAELAKALKHLEPAENQDMLPQILKRAGDEVAAFFANFPNTTCTEQVTSVVNTGVGNGEFQRSYAKYNYLALVQEGGAKDRLREFRADDKGKLIPPDPKHEVTTQQLKDFSASTVATRGFISMIEHFHPDFQPDSRFLYLGREEMQDKSTYVVAFAQLPSVARRVTRIQFLGQDEIAFVQGIAWIDPMTFRVRRLRTDVQVPPGHVGILKETTQILYSEVSFEQGGLKLWLPREVDVTGQLDQYRYHNQHRYSDYRLFKVQVEEK